MRLLGLDHGFPLVQLVAFTPVAMAGALGIAIVALLLRRRAAAPTPGSVGIWDADLHALPPADSHGPLRILAGDFNATLDHADLRRVLAGGYEDAASVVGAGLRPTWPTGRLVPPTVAIDHVLADERAGVRAVSVHGLPGTDHRAVLAELVLPRCSS